MRNHKGTNFHAYIFIFIIIGRQNVANGPQTPWYDIDPGVQGDHLQNRQSQTRNVLTHTKRKVAPVFLSRQSTDSSQRKTK